MSHVCTWSLTSSIHEKYNKDLFAYHFPTPTLIIGTINLHELGETNCHIFSLVKFVNRSLFYDLHIEYRLLVTLKVTYCKT